MLILLLCIFCNVLLAIIFKLFSQYGVDNLNGIIINYFSCVVLATILTGVSVLDIEIFRQSWFPYAICLAVLFIVGFNIMALSFQKAGVALTVIIQKMSLIIPSAFAIAFFGESLSFLKIVGIASALGAIILVNYPSKQDPSLLKKMSPVILLPLAIFVLSGFIEIILFYVEASGKLGPDGVKFTSTAFGLAGVLGLIYSIYRSITTKVWINHKDVVGGFILSLPNYLSIYLILVLLNQGWDGSVFFPLNNIGILLSTTLVGVLLYRERLNTIKSIGLLLGAAAIALIAIA